MVHEESECVKLTWGNKWSSAAMPFKYCLTSSWPQTSSPKISFHGRKKRREKTRGKSFTFLIWLAAWLFEFIHARESLEESQKESLKL